jgi:hypothetical protein
MDFRAVGAEASAARSAVSEMCPAVARAPAAPPQSAARQSPFVSRPALAAWTAPG